MTSVYWTIPYSRKKTEEFSVVNLTRPKPQDHDRKQPVRLPFSESSQLAPPIQMTCQPFVLSFGNMSKRPRISYLRKVSNVRDRDQEQTLKMKLKERKKTINKETVKGEDNF